MPVPEWRTMWRTMWQLAQSRRGGHMVRASKVPHCYPAATLPLPEIIPAMSVGGALWVDGLYLITPSRWGRWSRDDVPSPLPIAQGRYHSKDRLQCYLKDPIGLSKQSYLPTAHSTTSGRSQTNDRHIKLASSLDNKGATVPAF
jgi:hypothetical protein